MEYGLVLSGGGTKGSFEIGVWKALQELDINVTAVAGTSVGALNGAIIAGNELEHAIDFWTNLSMDQVFDINKLVTDKYISEWSKSDFKTFTNAFKTYLFEGGIDITPLRTNLAKYVNEETVRKSSIRLGLVTVSLTDFKPLELMIDQIPQGYLIDYLLASAAFPAFKKHEIDGTTFIDGGFYDNLPINLLASQGYNNLITVDLPAPGIKAKPKYKNLNITHIDNSEHLGLFFDFDPNVMSKNIKMGYLDTLKKFNRVKGTNYYLNLDTEGPAYSKFKHKLGSFLKGENGIKLPSLLGCDTILSKSELIKEISRFVNYTQYKNNDISLSLLEITARNLEINRLAIYTPSELIKKIFETVNRLLHDNIKLIKSNDNIIDIFKAPNEFTLNPLTNIKFMAYYMYFISLKANSINLLSKLVNRFSPETILSIITLLYLTDNDD
ncbi:patatin-like phospholipase family protein [Alkalibaculum sp. M08DMB]|uniref:Patatin-like phospholipase family protein n=1 Tax=Alkalibaculum sporogenes TaxID=2655001 RepID=A0A6A7K6H4_9FIRM|nr:patatin-like phospholipase family protein [Alkalibaculum sporogenes]MPW24982.1 patatin-like phospholipase family protein [Alkalibaculum sporogenes]